MANRENVIKGLEQFKSDFKPFIGNSSDWNRIDAALAFLKQKAGGEVGMTITEEMIAEDEKRWNDRNIVAELGYCGKNIRHRKNITKDDIRFYAYIMRKAHAMLKEQEPVAPGLEQDIDGVYSTCGNCKTRLWKMFGVEFEINPAAMPKFCPQCGHEVKWK